MGGAEIWSLSSAGQGSVGLTEVSVLNLYDSNGHQAAAAPQARGASQNAVPFAP